jgi:hypothetical protein
MQQSEGVKLLAGHAGLERWLPVLRLERPGSVIGSAGGTLKHGKCVMPIRSIASVRSAKTILNHSLPWFSAG